MCLTALCFQPACQASCCGRNQSSKGPEKIQAICNGKSMPSVMQGLARTREKPPTQEQWVAMEKQCEEQWKATKNTMGAG
jgi:hypothetical protein